MKIIQKSTKRDRIHDLIKMGIYTKKEIAQQLEMTVGSVAVHMTHLRWLGHFIVYDIDSKILKLTTEKEYARWVPRRKMPPTLEDQILKLHQKWRRIAKAQIKWQQKTDDELKTMSDEMEKDAQIILHKIYIERLETELGELETKLFAQKSELNQGVTETQ